MSTKANALTLEVPSARAMMRRIVRQAQRDMSRQDVKSINQGDLRELLVSLLSPGSDPGMFSTMVLSYASFRPNDILAIMAALAHAMTDRCEKYRTRLGYLLGNDERAKDFVLAFEMLNELARNEQPNMKYDVFVLWQAVKRYDMPKEKTWRSDFQPGYIQVEIVNIARKNHVDEDPFIIDPLGISGIIECSPDEVQEACELLVAEKKLTQGAAKDFDSLLGSILGHKYPARPFYRLWAPSDDAPLLPSHSSPFTDFPVVALSGS